MSNRTGMNARPEAFRPLEPGRYSGKTDNVPSGPEGVAGGVKPAEHKVSPEQKRPLGYPDPGSERASSLHTLQLAASNACLGSPQPADRPVDGDLVMPVAANIVRLRARVDDPIMKTVIQNEIEGHLEKFPDTDESVVADAVKAHHVFRSAYSRFSDDSEAMPTLVKAATLAVLESYHYKARAQLWACAPDADALQRAAAAWVAKFRAVEFNLTKDIRRLQETYPDAAPELIAAAVKATHVLRHFEASSARPPFQVIDLVRSQLYEDLHGPQLQFWGLASKARQPSESEPAVDEALHALRGLVGSEFGDDEDIELEIAQEQLRFPWATPEAVANAVKSAYTLQLVKVALNCSQTQGADLLRIHANTAAAAHGYRAALWASAPLIPLYRATAESWVADFRLRMGVSGPSASDSNDETRWFKAAIALKAVEDGDQPPAGPIRDLVLAMLAQDFRDKWFKANVAVQSSSSSSSVAASPVKGSPADYEADRAFANDFLSKLGPDYVRADLQDDINHTLRGDDVARFPMMKDRKFLAALAALASVDRILRGIPREESARLGTGRIRDNKDLLFASQFREAIRKQLTEPDNFQTAVDVVLAANPGFDRDMARRQALWAMVRVELVQLYPALPEIERQVRAQQGLTAPADRWFPL